MASFFDDLFDSITNQQATPQQTIINTNDLLNQTYGTLQGQIPNLTAYNQALVGATVPSQLQAEALYDPNAAALRSATSRSILDELNLGGTLGAELQEQVIRNALEGNAATGFGVGEGGRGLVARDLGLTGLDLARQRRGEAAAYARSGPTLSSLFQPSRGFDEGAISGDIRNVQAARDDLANITENIRRENFSSMINTGGRILGGIVGGVVGAYTGNVAGGIEAGQGIGGSIGGKTSVYGYQSRGQQQSGGGSGYGQLFGSLLKNLGTQGSYGQGSGGFYGMGANQYDRGADFSSDYSGIA